MRERRRDLKNDRRFNDSFPLAPRDKTARFHRACTSRATFARRRVVSCFLPYLRAPAETGKSTKAIRYLPRTVRVRARAPVPTETTRYQRMRTLGRAQHSPHTRLREECVAETPDELFRIRARSPELFRSPEDSLLRPVYPPLGSRTPRFYGPCENSPHTSRIRGDKSSNVIPRSSFRSPSPAPGNGTRSSARSRNLLHRTFNLTTDTRAWNIANEK